MILYSNYLIIGCLLQSDYNGFYTAWNSMPTLQMHGLVERLSGAAVGEAGVLYRLTEEGRNVARQLEEEDQDVRSGKKEAPAKTKRTEAAIQAGASAAAGDVITATSS
jgi:DNA-binding PadR family transcriptional regulator